MTASGLLDATQRAIAPVAVLVVAALSVLAAHAQTVDSKSAAEARVIVAGEGRVTVPPDYARITSGVTSTAKTVKEASDANAKIMSGMIATLADAGIAKKDIQTSEFSIEPIYASPSSKISTDAPNGAPKLSGFRVSNQVNVIIRQISQVADILDDLVKAGATNVGNVAFLVSDGEKALDQAREAAMANARHKAELYARASGVTLGRVTWITESADFEPIAPMGVARAKMAPLQRVPIESGEEAITARITVGFDIAQ